MTMLIPLKGTAGSAKARPTWHPGRKTKMSAHSLNALSPQSALRPPSSSVAVVLFVFSRLTGLFRAGTSEKPTVAVSTEAETASLEVNITDNQTYVPYILSTTEQQAREELAQVDLKLEVTGSDYSDNYPEGQIMAQTIVQDTVVDKGSTVGVTLSKGSDKVNLGTLNLTVLTVLDASRLLEEKGLAVDVKGEFSSTGGSGKPIMRFSPETAKIGERVTLFVSKGVENELGRVPNLIGQSQVSADALLAGAGLVTGNVTKERSDTVAGRIGH